MPAQYWNGARVCDDGLIRFSHIPSAGIELIEKTIEFDKLNSKPSLSASTSGVTNRGFRKGCVPQSLRDMFIFRIVFESSPETSLSNVIGARVPSDYEKVASQKKALGKARVPPIAASINILHKKGQTLTKKQKNP